MFEEKMKELLNAEFDAIPSKEELEKMYTFSERHEKNMEEIFKEESKENKKDFFVAFKKVAVIALAIIGCAFVSLKVVPTVYAYVETWMVENNEDRVILRDKDDTVDEGVADLRFALQYVPEGYEFVEETESEIGDIIIVYQNDADKKLKFEYSKAKGKQISADIENTIEEVVVVDGTQYYMFLHYDNSMYIVWKQNGYMFTIYGEISVDEMLNIVASVEAVED